MRLTRLGSGWRSPVEHVLAELAGHAAVARDPPAVALLGELLDLAVTWNERIDLTAARTADELVDLFVADAALLAAARTRCGGSWVDVGSGAGAPGLPLAVLRPDLELTLVDPREKRVAFLRSAIGELKLERVRVQRARGESLERACFDTAVSRATLPPRAWLELGARVAREDVWVLLARAEPPALDGWQIADDLRYRWPLTGVSRRALRFVPARSSES